MDENEWGVNLRGIDEVVSSEPMPKSRKPTRCSRPALRRIDDLADPDEHASAPIPPPTHMNSDMNSGTPYAIAHANHDPGRRTSPLLPVAMLTTWRCRVLRLLAAAGRVGRTVPGGR